MLEQFEKTWPEGFYNTISSKVKTMATTTKSIKIGDSKMYDLNVIYSRTIALFSSDRDVDMKDVLAYELAPVPTAMFTEDGMRICKAKSTLKKSLQVEVSRRNAGDADVTVIDGSALLWTIHWPADGTVADFIDNVKTRLISYLSESDVYLIFDRYYDYSIKSVTRDVRENRKHHLLLSTKPTAQKVVLSSIENKKQLNLLLFKELTEDRLFHLRGTNKHKLVVTGEDSCPIEIRMEERRSRYELENQNGRS
ncbi:Protein telomere ends associated [Dissostichus eleginoides]|uniref:Protein telomere ends associated n=1 Tax=Dissostichus eleginoides TaxID=100907 RepID=A0AAD9BXI2_DISEL|nr:Protein telomere ends associated [Dissostichus eleginoides]